MTDSNAPEDNTPEDSTPSAADNNSGQQNRPGLQFQLQKIYLKDLSFEAPLGAEAFQQQWQPKVGQELHTSVNQLDESLFEVTLKITINVALGEKTAFLVEVQQAGLFSVTGAEGPQLAQIVNTACPQILFPYVREVVDSCAIKGGFPALALPPINFDMLFARAVTEASRKAKTEREGQESLTN